MKRSSSTLLLVGMSVAFLGTGASRAADLPLHARLLVERASRSPAPPATSIAATERADATLLWSYSHSSFDHVRCVRGVEDMNGDGFGDALIAIDDANVGDDDLYLFSGASSVTPLLIWSFNSTRGASGGDGWGDYCIAQGPDFDGDLADDVLYGTAWGGRTFYALSDEGTEIFYYDTYESEPDTGWCYAAVSPGDVNGDLIPDVVAGFGSDCDAAVCLSGASQGSAAVLWRLDAPDVVGSVAAIRDVDDDGVDDVLLGISDNGYNLHCVSGASSGAATVLWSHSAGSVTHFEAASIRDVNDDGTDDALLGLWTGSDNVICLSGASTTNADVLWTATGASSYIMELRPIGDVDGDDVDDVLVASWASTVRCLSGADGSTVWTRPTGGDNWTVAPVGDQNFDGIPDALAGSFDGSVYCLNGTDGTILWSYPTGRRIYSVHAIPDVNGDGIEDVLAGTQGANAVAYCLTTWEDPPTATPVTTPTTIPTAPPTPRPTAEPSASPPPSPTGEPTATHPLGVRLDLPALVHPGEPFHVTGYLDNPGEPRAEVPTFFILQVLDAFYFWPSWALYDPPESAEIDFSPETVPRGTREIPVIASFPWPDTGQDALGGLWFHGAMLDEGLTEILGEMASEEWGYEPL